MEDESERRGLLFRKKTQKKPMPYLVIILETTLEWSVDRPTLYLGYLHLKCPLEKTDNENEVIQWDFE